MNTKDIENTLNAIKKIEEKIETFKEKLKKWGIQNKDIDSLTKFLNDYTQGLQFLAQEKFVLVEYKVKFYNKELCLSEFFDKYKYMIHALVYNNQFYGFYKFEEQLRNTVRDTFRYLKNEFYVFQEEDKNLFESILKLSLKDIIVPEKIVLKNGKELDVFYINK